MSTSVRICRFCLTTRLVDHSIFEDEVLLQKIKSAIPFNIYEEDQLPKHLCQFCYEKVHMIYHFFQTIENCRDEWKELCCIEEETKSQDCKIENDSTVEHVKSSQEEMFFENHGVIKNELEENVAENAKIPSTKMKINIDQANNCIAIVKYEAEELTNNYSLCQVADYGNQVEENDIDISDSQNLYTYQNEESSKDGNMYEIAANDTGTSSLNIKIKVTPKIVNDKIIQETDCNNTHGIENCKQSDNDNLCKITKSKAKAKNIIINALGIKNCKNSDNVCKMTKSKTIVNMKAKKKKIVKKRSNNKLLVKEKYQSATDQTIENTNNDSVPKLQNTTDIINIKEGSKKNERICQEVIQTANNQGINITQKEDILNNITTSKNAIIENTKTIEVIKEVGQDIEKNQGISTSTPKKICEIEDLNNQSFACEIETPKMSNQIDTVTKSKTCHPIENTLIQNPIKIGNIKKVTDNNTYLHSKSDKAIRRIEESKKDVFNFLLNINNKLKVSSKMENTKEVEQLNKNNVAENNIKNIFETFNPKSKNDACVIEEPIKSSQKSGNSILLLDTSNGNQTENVDTTIGEYNEKNKDKHPENIFETSNLKSKNVACVVKEPISCNQRSNTSTLLLDMSKSDQAKNGNTKVGELNEKNEDNIDKIFETSTLESKKKILEIEDPNKKITACEIRTPNKSIDINRMFFNDSVPKTKNYRPVKITMAKNPLKIKNPKKVEESNQVIKNIIALQSKSKSETHEIEDPNSKNVTCRIEETKIDMSASLLINKQMEIVNVGESSRKNEDKREVPGNNIEGISETSNLTTKSKDQEIEYPKSDIESNLKGNEKINVDTPLLNTSNSKQIKNPIQIGNYKDCISNVEEPIRSNQKCNGAALSLNTSKIKLMKNENTKVREYTRKSKERKVAENNIEGISETSNLITKSKNQEIEYPKSDIESNLKGNEKINVDTPLLNMSNSKQIGNYKDCISNVEEPIRSNPKCNTAAVSLNTSKKLKHIKNGNTKVGECSRKNEDECKDAENNIEDISETLNLKTKDKDQEIEYPKSNIESNSRNNEQLDKAKMDIFSLLFTIQKQIKTKPKIRNMKEVGELSKNDDLPKVAENILKTSESKSKNIIHRNEDPKSNIVTSDIATILPNTSKSKEIKSPMKIGNSKDVEELNSRNEGLRKVAENNNENIIETSNLKSKNIIPGIDDSKSKSVTTEIEEFISEPKSYKSTTLLNTSKSKQIKTANRREDGKFKRKNEDLNEAVNNNTKKICTGPRDTLQIKIEPIKDIWRCVICFESKTSKQHLLLHYEKHYKEHVTKIKNRQFYNLGTAEPLAFQCRSCYKIFLSEIPQSHLMTAHEDLMKLGCSLCPERFLYAENMLSHGLLNHINNTDNAKLFQHKLNTEAPMNKRSTSIEKIDLTEKNRQGSTNNLLSSDDEVIIVENASEKNVFNCDICNVTFSVEKFLERHILQQHVSETTKKTQCDFCSGKVYSIIYKEHLKTHDNSNRSMTWFSTPKKK